MINVQGAKQEKLQASCLPLGSQNNVYKLANSSNQFDLRLLDQITSTYDGNIILSSLSVVSVLSMVLLGAKGDTKEEMKMALAFPCNKDDLSQSETMFYTNYKAAHDTLKVRIFGRVKFTIKSLIRLFQSNDVKLESANKVYIDNHYQLKQEYSSNIAKYFSSQPDLMDFVNQPEASRQQINQWVASKTNNKIEELLASGSVSSATKMILVNAIYFKGKWLYQFDEGNTNQSGEFFLESGEVVTVPMMNTVADLQSGELPSKFLFLFI